MSEQEEAELIYAPLVEKARREAEMHKCLLPDLWRSDNRNAGAVAYCNECGTYWRYGFNWLAVGDEAYKWKKVRWYHFKTKGHINGR